MYTWFWRHLPGPLPAKLALSLVSFLAICVVLFLWIFPEVEELLPYNDVTVEQNGG